MSTEATEQGFKSLGAGVARHELPMDVGKPQAVPSGLHHGLFVSFIPSSARQMTIAKFSKETGRHGEMAQWPGCATEQRAGLLQIPAPTEMPARSRHGDPLVIPAAWEVENQDP